MARPPIPTEVVIEVTGQCRLSCTYCTSPDLRAAHVPINDIIETLDAAAELKVPAIRFTGGEPLLHPDLRAFLTYAHQLGFYTIINTSAEEISSSQIRILASTINCALISLQGYDHGSSEAYTRSPSAFDQKLKNIFALKALLPVLRLGTVITPALHGTFPQFAALVKKIAPVSWGLFRPISKAGDITQMDQAFYRGLLLNIIRLRKEGIHVEIANAIPLCVSGNINAGKEGCAGAIFDDGHRRIVRDAKGFFKPSYFINTPLGNDIATAWAHPLLEQLDRTDHLPATCQQCPLLDPCLGGSRAMSMLSGGSFQAADPLFTSPK